jgi:cytochrome c553
MKYVLPIFVALFFTACNDSNENTHSTTETNVTTIETNNTQTVAQTNTTIAAAKVTPVEISGETIFNKCKSCHGNSAEKKALNSSQIIKGWEVSKIEDALKGYQNGTYGASMKNIMAAQAKGLSDEEIKKVATYIHTL